MQPPSQQPEHWLYPVIREGNYYCMHMKSINTHNHNLTDTWHIRDARDATVKYTVIICWFLNSVYHWPTLWWSTPFLKLWLLYRQLPNQHFTCVHTYTHTHTHMHTHTLPRQLRLSLSGLSLFLHQATNNTTHRSLPQACILHSEQKVNVGFQTHCSL